MAQGADGNWTAVDIDPASDMGLVSFGADDLTYQFKADRAGNWYRERYSQPGA